MQYSSTLSPSTSNDDNIGNIDASYKDEVNLANLPEDYHSFTDQSLPMSHLLNKLKNNYSHKILEDDSSIVDAVYDALLAWHKSHDITLWPHQEDAILELFDGNHVILSTPTGSGKSLVAQALSILGFVQSRKVYYTAPIKALVSEKFFDAVRIFGAKNVGMITGDILLNSDAPLIFCTAEILAIDAVGGSIPPHSAIIMDEFHYYGDRERGWAWQTPLLSLPDAQFLLMSATLGDTTQFAKTLEKNTTREVSIIDTAQRPVPLTYRYEITPLTQCVEEILAAKGAPIYVVAFSQRKVMEYAEMLINFGVTTRDQREKIKEEIRHFSFTTGFGKTLRRLLLGGVGVHHAGMLPRYRRLIEKLTQKGLLPIICGTDTLGVGINVPIHTVLFTSLSKYDGVKERHLRAREFHQIAGRAGRSGFDHEGLVVALAPDFEIENKQIEEKIKKDPNKAKKLTKKKAPDGFVSWNEDTFTKLINTPSEELRSYLRITHSLVLSACQRGGDIKAFLSSLIERSAQSEAQKEKLENKLCDILNTLINTSIIEKTHTANGEISYQLTRDIPWNFRLNEPLSPFFIAVLELFDPQSDTYTADVLSSLEAILENPRPILRAQEKEARTQAMDRMKMDGVDYNTRMERLNEITYPQPLKPLLDEAFEHYVEDVPWAADYDINPKSVVRNMIETASTFTTYVSRYNLQQSEGILLKYLSDTYRGLYQTIPPSLRTEELNNIIAWLRVVIRGTDSSLLDEWNELYELKEYDQKDKTAFDNSPDPSLLVKKTHKNTDTHTFELSAEDQRGLELLIRNSLFTRVELIALDRPQQLGELDEDWDMAERQWDNVLENIYHDHEEILTDQQARSKKYFILDSKLQKEGFWEVRQILDDAEGDYDWSISGIVDLQKSLEQARAVFTLYEVCPTEESSLSLNG